jgi:hypothetical protein
MTPDGERVDKPVRAYRKVQIGGVSVFAHRVVWMAAHGPIPPGLAINHRDRDGHNNALINLELVTDHGNNKHALGLHYDHIPGVGDGDIGAVSREWLAQVQALVASGEVTRADIEQLRGAPEERTYNPFGRAMSRVVEQGNARRNRYVRR